MPQKVTIKIPKDLYDRLKRIVKNTGFSSVTELIVYTMRDIAAGGSFDDQLTPKEVEKVRARLKALGYL
ncbi:MAG: ribbon-helix-helix domain-containing protein [Candidatus Aenigmatarchaeota archaeon]